MPNQEFFINRSDNGQDSIIIFHSGMHYIINCVQHGKPQLTMATTILLLPLFPLVASIFGHSVPPLVNSSQVSSPIPNPPPPYGPQAIPLFPPTLQSQRKHHFHQIYEAFNHMFQCYI
ncbi:hypothetical protein O181_049770 [Austropuccinia psidii MF-1]|uniref:Uncharacterized protein n=1 Tax=Austropuccinia psidii MF-1 TaxID=1389203 RepID=A0A9Q3HQC7_9BASI|nr:hypothetical protein [Austropuccinia psidii MF-1]